ncbi:uncharacterized protein LOC131530424 isoform X2 [Onychostoma macrolepis]|uniref:uncharacterized protein LOC131530424 isoform X2 n=1 Tax=Onychostoma macrolepis TaxID=369639 RepID=UPI002729F7FD|nr:uncharacterized protein LOC131530424 isoform X2 [Onychostoma macrolepis]
MSGHTLYKKFSVTVSEPKKRVKKPPPDLGLSAVIGIIVAVLLVIAAAVISHRCMVFDQARQMRRTGPKTVSVMERQHVTLVADVVIEDGEQVQWSFEGKTITTGMNRDINKTSYSDDEQFRDRLELQHRTADLLIKNTKPATLEFINYSSPAAAEKSYTGNISLLSVETE